MRGRDVFRLSARLCRARTVIWRRTGGSCLKISGADMEKLSEKELEQLRKLAQLRKFVQTILAERVWLLAAIFLSSLVAVTAMLYYRVVASPERYFSQVNLHFYPKQTDRIKAYDDKYVLQLLNRQTIVNRFHSDSDDNSEGSVSIFYDKKRPNSYTITLYAHTAEEAINGVNAFAEACVREYTEERTNDLRRWRDVFAEKKEDVFNKIQAINAQKEEMLVPLEVISPEDDYERLRIALSGQQDAKLRLSLSIRSLSERCEKMKSQLASVNPGLLECGKEIKEFQASLKQIDRDILVAGELYTAENPKLQALISRRAVLEGRYEEFLSRKGISPEEVDSMDASERLNLEYQELEQQLSEKQEDMDALEEEILESDIKLRKISEILPVYRQLEQQRASLLESLSNLDNSSSDIEYLILLVKDDLFIGERAETAYGENPLRKNNLAIGLFVAVALTAFLGTMMVLAEFFIGRVESARELTIMDELHYLGFAADSEELLASDAAMKMELSGICSRFCASVKESHVMLAGALRGGKLVPSFYETLEWYYAMAGRRILKLNMVLAGDIDEAASAECEDTGIVIYSGNRGILPVASKNFLSPSEIELLRIDLETLRKSYDLIVIRHYASPRKSMITTQLGGLCDSLLLAVGLGKTPRRHLRAMIALCDDIKLPIRTILTGKLGRRDRKDKNLEVLNEF